MTYRVARVYHSVMYPSLMFGLPRNMAYILLIATFAMVVALTQIWFLVPAGAIFFVFRGLTERDPFFFETAWDAIRLVKEAD